MTLTALATAVPLAAQPVAPFQVERTGHGRAMILIPGLLSSGEVWRGTVERFRADHELHVLTLAGFAGAPPTSAGPFLAALGDTSMTPERARPQAEGMRMILAGLTSEALRRCCSSWRATA